MSRVSIQSLLLSSARVLSLDESFAFVIDCPYSPGASRDLNTHCSQVPRTIRLSSIGHLWFLCLFTSSVMLGFSRLNGTFGVYFSIPYFV
jgi:hypothetical protein